MQQETRSQADAKVRAALLLIVIGVIAAFGQDGATKPAFDVVSVKPNLAGGPTTDVVPRRTGERVTMHNSDLVKILAWAYRLNNPSYQIVPGRWEKLLWESYDIDAIVPVGTTEADLRLMFQALLKDRFKFKSHLQAKQLPAYDLVVMRGGPHLAAAKSGPRRSLGVGGSSSWVEIRKTGSRLVGVGASIAEIVVVLSSQLEVPIRDRTGLEGTYDVSLMFSLGPEPSTAPVLQTAIRDLGLDLKKTNAVVDQRLIDYMEKPSANE